MAARSGTTSDFWTGGGSAQGGTYSAQSCGNDVNDTSVKIQDGSTNPPLSDYAWFCGNRYDSTYYNGSKPVALKLPNGFGLYDMHGNVYEWTADWWGYSYPQSGGSWCGTSASGRVGRGGSWGNHPISLRASNRYYYGPSNRYRDMGFRLRKISP